MYGHDGTSPTRGAVTVIALRVLFAAAGLLSCGLFACLPLFQVALRRGRWFDWAAAWTTLPVSIGLLMVVGTLPYDDHWGDVALTGSLVLSAASVAYYLVSDIRFHRARRRSTGHAPPHARTAPEGYGYPQPLTAPPPYTGPSAPQPYALRPPVPDAYAPGTPVPRAAVPGPPIPPAPPHPAPARIDQVRAELDELSDYLRRHGDQVHGEHEGGR
ncbi:hypothetical protein ACFV06_18280 [Streptomyces sp. NPDC059618]|uniref:hypothetical protein n=1 Tax=Streptomyces sp. NPDC059618 TaxID=3346887 RepID=UPI00368851FC